VSALVPKGISSTTAFYCDAMSQDVFGTIYVVRNNSKSELWRFDQFTTAPGTMQDTVSMVVQISGVKDKTRSLAGHPNGYLYACDDDKWYRISPTGNPATSTTIFSDSSGLKGMGFLFEREDLKYTGTPIPGKINVCHFPPGNCANAHTILIGKSAMNGHKNHGNGSCTQDYEGYCGGIAPPGSLTDTTIQVKIISWEELPGDLAHQY